MIADSEISSSTVREYAGHMARTYGASIAPKASSSLMRAAAGALHVLGIGLGGERFMTRVVTTMGSRIFVPFELGETGGPWSPWQQIEVLAHECQHVHQHDRDGLVGPGIAYLVDTSHRTATEAEANVTSAELHHWRYGVIEGWWMDHKAEGLHGYGASARDVEHIRTHLQAVAPTIRRGGLITHAGRTAIAWLDAHAPELRHPTVSTRSSS